MVKYTTPTFVLTFDEEIDFTQPGHVYVTLKQGFVEITKKDNELELGPSEISVFLSQEETGKFKEGMLELMVNWTFEDGALRGSSDIQQVKVTRNLLAQVAE